MSEKLCDRVLRKEERFDEGNSYSYELVVREGETVADFRLPLYSIRVDMTDTEGNRRQADARDVFSNAEKAIAFFDKIVRNLATPIDLAYILEDEMV